MAVSLPGDPSHHGVCDGGPSKLSQDKQEEIGGKWYYSRKEIEENSPSRGDGIDLKKETYLRKSYCTFLQDLGMRLKVPQVTIATAIVFCHRFFLRQSHAKNDRRIIATVCMFLAGKVEETPRPLKDVILVSYEIVHKKDPAAVQKIKQKEVYEQQKELILLGERVVLATLGFDLNVHHPYKPLVEAIKKFKVAQNALAQVAWNFVNDGLRTSLCLQFMPHHIAAGAIFLAAKFLKVKLPSDGEKVWWQEFDVTPRQLEEVSNQMLELYEQNRVPPSQASEAEGSGVNQQAPTKVPTASEEQVPNNSGSLGSGAASRAGVAKLSSQQHGDNGGTPRTMYNQSNDYRSTDLTSTLEQKEDGDINKNLHREPAETVLHKGNVSDTHNTSRYGSGGNVEEVDQDGNGGRTETRESGELKEKYHGRNLEYNSNIHVQSPQEAIKKIDRDKVKAALEKRRKSRGDTTRKTDLMDEDDLIERELEDGIEIAAENEKSKWERKQNWSKNHPDHESLHHVKLQDGAGEGHHEGGMKMKSSRGQDFDAVEEGELETFDNIDNRVYRSPKLSSRKRKTGSPLDKTMEGKQRHDYIPGSHKYNHHDFPEDRNKLGRAGGYSERDHKRQVQENHV